MMEDRLLRELYDTYYKYVYRLASNRLYTYTGSSADAQDVVQEVFLLAAQKEIYGHPNPAGWLAAVTNNICMNYGKRAARNQKKLRRIVESNPNPDPLNSTADATGDVDLDLMLQSLLPPDDYRILVEYYMKERSLSEIAAEMGLSYVNVRVRIHRCRAYMKKFLLDM